MAAKAVYLTSAVVLPLLGRGLLIWRFRRQMSDVLPEEEQDREGNRALILAFAGFSFTGVVALAVLDSAIARPLQGAALFLLVSFLAYLWSLNMQCYKARRWQDEAGTALSDVGTLCLILALADVLLVSSFESVTVAVAIVLACGVWLADFSIRLTVGWGYLLRRERWQKEEVTISG